MELDKKKQLSIRIDEEIHKQMKLYTVEQGISIQDYLTNLIKTDMKKNKKGEHMK